MKLNFEKVLEVGSEHIELQKDILQLNFENRKLECCFFAKVHADGVPSEVCFSSKSQLSEIILAEHPLIVNCDYIFTSQPLCNLFFTLASGPLLWITLLEGDGQCSSLDRIVSPLE